MINAIEPLTVPLCRLDHRGVHRTGDERAWWTAAGINPTKIAQNLWRQTRGTQGVRRVERSAKSLQREIASPPAQAVSPIDVDASTEAIPR